MSCDARVTERRAAGGRAGGRAARLVLPAGLRAGRRGPLGMAQRDERETDREGGRARLRACAAGPKVLVLWLHTETQAGGSRCGRIVVE